MVDELKIYQKWEDMVEYGYIALRQYPRSEKLTLSKETRETIWAMGALIIRANYIRNREHRKRLIKDIDFQISKLKVLIRVGFRLKFLPTKKYEVWSRQLSELGKMIGGWWKSAS